MSFHRFRPHPWHGLSAGPAPPSRIDAYIEITPYDLVKYEIDKETGYLRVDRPQRTSSLPPSLYGFIPRTYCGERVAALLPGAARGDGDPLDVCVLTERPIMRADLLLTVKVVGGLPMVDGGEADDKILAVVESDPAFGRCDDVSELPREVVDRLQHYFLTYKALPGEPSPVSIAGPYGRKHAEAVVTASLEDYAESFGDED